MVSDSMLIMGQGFFKSFSTKLVEGKDKLENFVPVVLEGHTNLQNIVPNTAVPIEIGSWNSGSQCWAIPEKKKCKKRPNANFVSP